MASEEVEDLLEDFPAWSITVSTPTTNSGPETFTLIAKRDGMKVVAFSVHSMRVQLSERERKVG